MTGCVAALAVLGDDAVLSFAGAAALVFFDEESLSVFASVAVALPLSEMGSLFAASLEVVEASFSPSILLLEAALDGAVSLTFFCFVDSKEWLLFDFWFLLGNDSADSVVALLAVVARIFVLLGLMSGAAAADDCGCAALALVVRGRSSSATSSWTADFPFSICGLSLGCSSF